MATRVLVVEDDHELRRATVAHLDDPAHGFEVCAACESGEAVVALLHAGLELDVALVDLGLPGMSGFELIQGLRAARPNAVSLAYSVFDDADSVVAALEAGARGYLAKSTPLPRVCEALNEALAGGSPMTPSIARLVVERLLARSAPAQPEPGADALTPREREVLALLARGLTYAEVARALGIALGTVQSHVKALYGKLEIGTKAEAAAAATRLGMS